MPWHAMPCHGMPCHAMPCHAILHIINWKPQHTSFLWQEWFIWQLPVWVWWAPHSAEPVTPLSALPVPSSVSRSSSYNHLYPSPYCYASYPPLLLTGLYPSLPHSRLEMPLPCLRFQKKNIHLKHSTRRERWIYCELYTHSAKTKFLIKPCQMITLLLGDKKFHQNVQ